MPTKVETRSYDEALNWLREHDFDVLDPGGDRSSGTPTVAAGAGHARALDGERLHVIYIDYRGWPRARTPFFCHHTALTSPAPWVARHHRQR